MLSCRRINPNNYQNYDNTTEYVAQGIAYIMDVDGPGWEVLVDGRANDGYYAAMQDLWESTQTAIMQGDRISSKCFVVRAVLT